MSVEKINNLDMVPKGHIRIIDLKKRICPKCTKIIHFEYDSSYAGCTNKPIFLVKRINSKTKDWFYGCPNFPKCKYSENRPETLEENKIRIWAWANAQGGYY